MAPARLLETLRDEIFDIIIIGAGPCGLATAARLREPTPAALFTDEEHRRYHWIGKHGANVSLKHVRSGKIDIKTTKRGHGRNYKMLVLDADEDKWLGRWKRLFATYGITHLRSPMLWHVDPLDRDSLIGHAWETDKEKELIEIKNCVGKEISKHAKKKKMAGKQQCGGRAHSRVAINQRDHLDYYRPSQSLFCDHCERVADRYHLSDDLIRKEVLQDLDYDVVHGVSINDEKLFTVTTNQYQRYARTVILAVGPANKPSIPRLPSLPSGPLPQACHTFNIKRIPDPIVQARIVAKKPTNVLVIGGGLTSAQISDLAIRQGVTKVWHFLRGNLMLKHFDVDLQWMGKYRNGEQARFWSADSDEERLEIIKEARGGGSMTTVYYKVLEKHMSANRLDLRVRTKVVDAKFETENGRGTWRITTDPPDETLPRMDYIYFATGIQTDFATLPYLETMLHKYPLQGFGGFPCITEDLTWKSDVPLFMTGKLAALQIGPAAPNIGGAKIGAERVAWAIEDLAGREGWDGVCGDDEEGEEEEGKGYLKGYMSGHGNMYDALGLDVGPDGD